MRTLLTACALSSSFAAMVQAQDPLLTLRGETDYALFGHSLCSLGDVDGDGHDDILVGAYGVAPGRVRAYSGASGALLYELAGISTDKNSFGLALDSAGDVNADGVPDFIVGVPKHGLFTPYMGRVDVRSGADGSVIHRTRVPVPNAWNGYSVGGGGDVNGDGFDDWVSGAPWDDVAANNAGRAYVHSGADGSILWEVAGLAPDERLGFAVDLAGDVNGDGLTDVVVGAPAAGDGRVQVHSGADGSLLHSWAPSGTRSYGFAVSAAGDVNGDGRADVLIGDPEAGSEDRGRVEIRSGATGVVLWSYDGQFADEGVGRSVSEAGDLDGDGHDDVLFGALTSSSSYARAISGATGAVLAHYEGVPTLGEAVAAGGDVDGDGLLDILLGASQALPVTLGAAFVHPNPQTSGLGLQGPHNGPLRGRTTRVPVRR